MKPERERKTLKHLVCGLCKGTGKVEGRTCPECEGRKFVKSGTRGAEK